MNDEEFKKEKIKKLFLDTREIIDYMSEIDNIDNTIKNKLNYNKEYNNFLLYLTNNSINDLNQIVNNLYK